jgi:hypothetical protein
MPVFEAVEGSTYRYASARKGGPLTPHRASTREPQTLRGMLHRTQVALLSIQEVNDVWAPNLSAREECHRDQARGAIRPRPKCRANDSLLIPRQSKKRLTSLSSSIANYAG